MPGKKVFEIVEVVIRLFIKRHMRAVRKNNDFGIWEHIVHFQGTGWSDLIVGARDN